MITYATVSTISVTHQFISYHAWPDAPEKVQYLRNVHRHLFKVELELSVSHNDRQLEFFIVQDELINVCHRYEQEVHGHSCETMAGNIVEEMIKRGYPAMRCTVSEDGENYGTVLVVNIKQSLQVKQVEGNEEDKFIPMVSDDPIELSEVNTH